MTNFDVDEEIKQINREYRKGRQCNRSRDGVEMRKILMMLGLAIFIFISTRLAAHTAQLHSIEAECPSCERPMILRAEDIVVRYVHHTWTCQNPNCGYENFDGIEYCGVCGTKRGEIAPRRQ